MDNAWEPFSSPIEMSLALMSLSRQGERNKRIRLSFRAILKTCNFGSKLTGSCRSGWSRYEGCRTEKRSSKAVKGSSQVLWGLASVRWWSEDANGAPASGYEVQRGLLEVKCQSRKVTREMQVRGRGRQSATLLERDSSVVNGLMVARKCWASIESEIWCQKYTYTNLLQNLKSCTRALVLIQSYSYPPAMGS